MNDSDRWILSFYRHSEISGALFFGRLARSFRPGPIQRDMTHHFADESQHARYWTQALEDMGGKPERVRQAYQDQYLDACGLPTNVMEVLAITRVFEARVIGQYQMHSRVPDLHPVIKGTIDRIMEDEKWHIEWVGKALKDMEKDYGADVVQSTVQRYKEADEDVYQKTIQEHADRLRDILRSRDVMP